VATATVAELRDLEYKVRRAMEFHGARYLHVLVPCPLGWGSASHDTMRIARLAKESGLFPVFEAEHSEMVSVAKIRRRVPVEDYLRPQARYKHLFGEHPRTDVIARIPAGDSARILDAVSVLRGVAGEQPPMLGRRVVVYGGGNTALDTARTAKRLGATDAVVVCRRTRERMPAHDIEVSQALEEGITVKWLSTITHAGDATIMVEKMRLDDTGFPQATGEFEELAADTVILALGQEADLSLLAGLPGIEQRDGVVKVGPNLMTVYRAKTRHLGGPGILLVLVIRP
jgi:Pyridine nucleotide-disulphide oxidoreductase